MRGFLTAAASAIALCLGVTGAQAEDLKIVVGTAPGGSYDLIGRLVARHIGKQLPGNTNVLVQNMPGAGSLTAASYLYNVAPQDGSVMGVLVPAILFNQIFGEENIRFDGAKFQWIGNPMGSPVVSTVFHTAPIKTWRDALTTTVIMGAPGSTAPDATTAHLVNATLGTKFTVVSGYKGGQDIVLAMERGEVHGRASQTWAGWQASKPDWIKEGKLVPLFHVSRKPVPELKEIPLLIDLVQGDANKALVRAYVNVMEIGRPLVAGPGVPAERVTALRRAFDTMVKDTAFIADADKMQVELGPIPGEELQNMVREVTSLDPALVERLKEMIR
jgi:tripartite-type tricarboxylate transporter receptor subunit TctC